MVPWQLGKYVRGRVGGASMVGVGGGLEARGRRGPSFLVGPYCTPAPWRPEFLARLHWAPNALRIKMVLGSELHNQTLTFHYNEAFACLWRGLTRLPNPGIRIVLGLSAV